MNTSALARRGWLSFVTALALLLGACEPTAVSSDNPLPKKIASSQPTESKTTAASTSSLEPSPAASTSPTLFFTPTYTNPQAETLSLAQRTEPGSLHSLVNTMTGAAIILSALFAPCTRQAWQPASPAWVPVMCERAPTLQNGGAIWVGEGPDRHLEVTFRLKDGWTWQDGVPVTAQDYVYTWKLALDPALYGEVYRLNEAGYFWLKIHQAGALDDQTLVLRYHSQKTLEAEALGQGRFPGMQAEYARLKEAFPSGPVVSAEYPLLGSPLPEHLLGQIHPADQVESDWAYAPVGNGAYQWKAWTPGVRILLEANPTFLLGRPSIQILEIRFIGEAGTVVEMLRTGKIQGATQDGTLDASLGPELDALEGAGIGLFAVPTTLWEHIDLNVTRFPFDDLRVRRALAYATDKQELVDKIYGGWLEPQDSFVPDSHWAYGHSVVGHYDYEPDQARALLAEAGWDCSQLPCTRPDPEGETLALRFTLATTDRPDRQALAKLLQAQWAKAGFEVALEFFPGRSLYDPADKGGLLQTRDFNAALFTWSTVNPALDVSTWYACGSIPAEENGFTGSNFSGWCRADLDETFSILRSDPDVRLDREMTKALLTVFQEAWTSDLPVIPLFHYVTLSAMERQVKGYAPAPFGYEYELWNAWEWEIGSKP